MRLATHASFDTSLWAPWLLMLRIVIKQVLTIEFVRSGPLGSVIIVSFCPVRNHRSKSPGRSHYLPGFLLELSLHPAEGGCRVACSAWHCEPTTGCLSSSDLIRMEERQVRAKFRRVFSKPPVPRESQEESRPDFRRHQPGKTAPSDGTRCSLRISASACSWYQESGLFRFRSRQLLWWRPSRLRTSRIGRPLLTCNRNWGQEGCGSCSQQCGCC